VPRSDEFFLCFVPRSDWGFRVVVQRYYWGVGVTIARMGDFFGIFLGSAALLDISKP